MKGDLGIDASVGEGRRWRGLQKMMNQRCQWSERWTEQRWHEILAKLQRKPSSPQASASLLFRVVSVELDFSNDDGREGTEKIEMEREMTEGHGPLGLFLYTYDFLFGKLLIYLIIFEFWFLSVFYILKNNKIIIKHFLKYHN